MIFKTVLAAKYFEPTLMMDRASWQAVVKHAQRSRLYPHIGGYVHRPIPLLFPRSTWTPTLNRWIL